MSATLRVVLVQAAQRLAAISPTPQLDAEILLAAALARPRSYLYAWPESILEPAALAQFQAWLARRASGEPLAYLLGRREFWSLELAVTPATLIPRPETELLVELALARLPTDQAATVADLGTGSGAIALALAQERPLARITATDCSTAALAVAQRNATRLELANVTFRQGDWCAALGHDCFALIVANPPYVATDAPEGRDAALRFEPSLALFSGADGLDALRTIIAQAPTHLTRGGWLLLEHGAEQGAAVTALLRQRGFTAVGDALDLAGRSRVSLGCWPG